MKTHAKVLAEAAELLRRGYCKGPLATDALGNAVEYDSKAAACFCVRGAIHRAARNLRAPLLAPVIAGRVAEQTLATHHDPKVAELGVLSALAAWSDRPETIGGPSADDVAAFLDLAALVAERPEVLK